MDRIETIIHSHRSSSAEHFVGAAMECRPYKDPKGVTRRTIVRRPVCISISPFGHKDLPFGVTQAL